MLRGVLEATAATVLTEGLCVRDARSAVEYFARHFARSHSVCELVKAHIVAYVRLPRELHAFGDDLEEDHVFWNLDAVEGQIVAAFSQGISIAAASNPTWHEIPQFDGLQVECCCVDTGI